MSRNPTRAQIRANVRDEVYEQRKRKARTGRELLDAAQDLLLAELTDLAIVNPDAEDEACRRLAEDMESIARDTRKETERERKTQLALREQERRQGR